jgi:aspartyl-tRNA(Asn)/glutamyl-tRNA(Gln) amidotransferase subunit A
MPRPTLDALAGALASGETTSRALIENSLARIADPAGEGARAFLIVYAERARREAEGVDLARAHGLALPRYAGIPISIKDLFDVAGEPTRVGSRALADAPAASEDALAVARLRRAGFVVVGKANMSEFAYSGLGRNPHYGTPLSPWDRARGHIPGGSTSGGAVGVADGMVAATLGSDTGGSCRIPAAFCGIVGFKPTAHRVPSKGAFPLAPSLDSIGPLANSARCCAALDSVLSGGDGTLEAPPPVVGLRIGVIEGYVDERLHAIVSNAYREALERLENAGARLTPVKIPELAELPAINRGGSIGDFEAFAGHRHRLPVLGALYDPWVLARFEGGRDKNAADYMDLLAHRARIRAGLDARTGIYDALALPSVPIVPPTLAELEPLDISRALNQLILRNTVIANFLDRPAVSIPCTPPGAPPAGFMLMGESDGDRRLLAVAAAAEAAIRAA